MSDDCPTCGGEIDDLGRSLPPIQPDGYHNPAVAVDAACTRSNPSGIEILMITRNLSPGQGLLALPGGFVDYGEDPEDAVLRELVEETGLVGTLNKLLCVRGDPERDPRKHIVSVVYLVDVERDADLKAGDDASAAGWYSLQELLELPDQVAFDHREILGVLYSSITSG